MAYPASLADVLARLRARECDRGAVVSASTALAETYSLGADTWQIELLAALKPRQGSEFPARVFAIVDPG